MTVMTKIANGQTAAVLALGIGGMANLRTPCGPRRIENLRKGDLVVTRDNGLQPVRMVWSRTITAAQIAADPSLAPVRLKPRAIGPMMPKADLLIAGDHRVLVPGYRLADMPAQSAFLLPAREIAGLSDAAYFDRAPDQITLYNVVFDAHEVVCANGLPVESFLPNPQTLALMDEAACMDLLRIFPSVKRAQPAYPAARYAAPGGKDYNPEFV